MRRTLTYTGVQLVYVAVIQDVVGVGNDLAHKVNLSCAESEEMPDFREMQILMGHLERAPLLEYIKRCSIALINHILD